jgi:hypothetical protein
MRKTINPHPKMVKDEATGTYIPNIRFDDWESGYKSGVADAVCSGFYDIAAALIHVNCKPQNTLDKT